MEQEKKYTVELCETPNLRILVPAILGLVTDYSVHGNLLTFSVSGGARNAVLEELKKLKLVGAIEK